MPQSTLNPMTKWKYHRDTIVASERFVSLSKTGSIKEAVGAVTSALMFTNNQLSDVDRMVMPSDREILKEVMLIRDEPEAVQRGEQYELFG